MVVFTCNNCGDSVKKPKVEKHITLECKKKHAVVSLCCIDCLQDFKGNAYVEHTKCVSELERYSAKGFVPKPGSNKGERKQNSWIDTVASVLNQTSLNKAQRDLLQAISSFENVPRKKVKFQNFIKSSIRNMKIQSHVVENVFDLIEKEFKTSCAANSALSSSSNGTPEKKVSLKNDEKSANISGMDLPSTEPVVESSNLESVPKDSVPQEPPAFEEEENNGMDNPEEPSKKKTKKEKKRITELTESNEQAELPTVKTEAIVEEVLSKKKKRKEKEISQLIIEKTEDMHPAKEFENDVSDISNKQDSKKKKRKMPTGKQTDDDVSESKIAKLTDAPMDEQVLSNKKSQNEKSQMKNRNCEKNSSVNNVIENGVTGTADVNKKNSKKKKQTDDDGLENKKSELTGKPIDEPVSNKKKKRKQESQMKNENCNETSSVNGAENHISDDVNQKERKKNKKRKMQNIDKQADDAPQNENVDSTEKADAIIEEKEKNISGCNEFSWEEVVKSLLENSTNKQMSLKKMIKKVVKKYQDFYSTDKSAEYITKKFNKQMKKISGIEIQDDRITLCS